MSQFKTGYVKFAAFSLLLCFAPLLQAASANLDREFDVAAGGTLVLESDAGSIEVSTWDQSQVRVRVSNADDFEVEFNQQGNDVYVKAESQRGGRGLFGFRRNNNNNISFVVNVPVNYNLELDTGGGHIEVSDITGNVEADTSGGHIEIGKVTAGDVNADTSGGHITIDDVEGDVVADTSGGRITIANVTGDVDADTSGGRIQIGDVGGDMVADTSGGNIEVGTGGGTVELDTSGGSIRAAWATGAISADTSGGNIYLAGSDVSVSADTSGGNIEILGSGGPVEADTSGGRITIRGTLGPIHADTAGGSIDVDLSAVRGTIGGRVELETAGGDVTVRIPSNLSVSIDAEIRISRRSRGDYRIYSDFPITNSEEDRRIIGRGDINGGGDRITVETSNSDIHIISVMN